ncbi:MAG: hypothetical protein L0F83_06785 [Lactococcus raffinolactis]|nr:hypothetical protein [Lactococcus raffinolactis]MDN5434758.1 hypothetical protein [Acinetobacter sp.]MDN5473315.1 hypothetical protein [Lactococcus raffinolactis]MDN5488353.1 hypothetical protein [Lactococcus lactis]MDN5691813.1 hypothetical protein [Acinetobacter sp.]
MAVANTTFLQYLGKYVSFTHDSSFEKYGVVNSVIFEADGSVQFSIGWDDFYDFAQVDKLKMLGEVLFYPE